MTNEESKGAGPASVSTDLLERGLREASDILESARDDLCRARRRLGCGRYGSAKVEAVGAQIGLRMAADRIESALSSNDRIQPRR